MFLLTPSEHNMNNEDKSAEIVLSSQGLVYLQTKV
jgi:hypothetical protein